MERVIGMRFAILRIKSGHHQVVTEHGIVLADRLSSEEDAQQARNGIISAYNLGKEDKLAELREFLNVPRKS